MRNAGPRSSGFVFIVLTYLATWTIQVPLALAAHHQLSFAVPRWIQIGSTLSPGIIAVILAACLEGRAGIKRLLGAIITWRVPPLLYAAALLLPAACVVPALVLYCFGLHQPLDLSEWSLPLILFFVFLPFSPLFEEVGWRGYLLPRLQARLHPVLAAVLLGLVWGAWHIPMILTQNAEGDRTGTFLVEFILGTIPLSILFTWLFNRSGQSLLITILFHAAVNATFALFAKVPTGELRPFGCTMIMLTAFAAFTIWKTQGRLGLPASA
jgi:membrane protease YdiL (CAAX protease family)